MDTVIHADCTLPADFDEAAWRERCDAFGDSANHGCGQLYELYASRLCGYVDGALARLPEAHRAYAIHVAREWGYVTTAEAAEAAAKADPDDYYCGHGFPPNCCPLGCDDRDDGPIDSEFERMIDEQRAELDAEFAEEKARDAAVEAARASEQPLAHANLTPTTAPTATLTTPVPTEDSTDDRAPAGLLASMHAALRHPGAAWRGARESRQLLTVGYRDTEMDNAYEFGGAVAYRLTLRGLFAKLRKLLHI